MRKSVRSRILVTGASGFVGGAVAAELARQGWSVRGTFRTVQPAIPGVEFVRVADLLDMPALETAMAGVSGVVHAAGLAHVSTASGAGDSVMYRVNVGGTKSVLEAAVAAGAERFVFVSSIAAASRGVDDVSDRSEGQPDGSYGRSKRQAEEFVIDVTRAGALKGTVLRPAMVYGPGMRGNPLRLLRLLQRKVPLPLGRVQNRRSVLFSGNLATLVAQVLSHPAPPAGPLHVADDELVSTTQFARLLAHSLNVEARLIPVPTTALRIAGRLASLLTGNRLDASGALRALATLTVADTRLATELDFRMPYSLGEGIARTAQAYTGNGGHPIVGAE